jgi:uncharacterized protein (DUF2237 family)
MNMSLNVLGQPLVACSYAPLTGYFGMAAATHAKTIAALTSSAPT